MPITVTNLTGGYGAGTPFETTALRDVSVTVENGSFVGILGRTGCGKSTALRMVRREASSFLAVQGPMNTMRTSGWSFLYSRAVSTMGVMAMEI